jgi:hypothetical protein
VGDDCNDGYEDKVINASQANDGLKQNLVNRGQSNAECEDWTVYFRPVNKIMAKQMQRPAMYLRRRLYCKKSPDDIVKHIWDSVASDI